MTLSSTEMQRLEEQSASFHKPGHKIFLSEAMNATRGSLSPLASVKLLSMLSRNARKDQQDAIRDVRRWIDGRLRDDPKITTERFLLELGWLRRMCVARIEGTMLTRSNETR